MADSPGGASGLLVRGYKGKELLFRADGYDQPHVGGTRPSVTHTWHPLDEWILAFRHRKTRSAYQQFLQAIRGVAFEAVPVGRLLTANTICGPRYGTETLRIDRDVAA